MTNSFSNANNTEAHNQGMENRFGDNYMNTINEDVSSNAPVRKSASMHPTVLIGSLILYTCITIGVIGIIENWF